MPSFAGNSERPQSGVAQKSLHQAAWDKSRRDSASFAGQLGRVAVAPSDSSNLYQRHMLTMG